MTRITKEQMRLTHKIIVTNAYENKREKPDFLSKVDFKHFKKFGCIKCLWCKEHFIKHRSDHNYCSTKCRVYHFRKVERKQNVKV
jgi:hypothetical protein